MKRYIHAAYIRAMSIEKSKLEKRMEAWSVLIAEHLAKCAMYGDSLGQGKYNHWVEHELATWLSDTNEIVCKHNNKKLKPRQYEEQLFGWLGNSRADARVNLHELQRKNRSSSEPYPEVEVDDKMIEGMYQISQAVIERFVPLLATRNSLTKQDIESILHNIMDPICTGRS